MLYYKQFNAYIVDKLVKKQNLFPPAKLHQNNVYNLGCT